MGLMDLVWFGASGFAIYVLFDLEKERLKLEKSYSKWILCFIVKIKKLNKFVL